MRSSPNPLLRFTSVLVVVLSPAAFATTRYVNGVTGSDTNNCLSPTTACKTIHHSISRSVSGDTIRIAAATYKENLVIKISLNLFGAGAPTTIIDGGGGATVVTISSASAHVTISNLTVTNGNGFASHVGGGLNNQGMLTINRCGVTGNRAAPFPNNPGSGGGVYNSGKLTINQSTISDNLAPGAMFLESGSGGGVFKTSGGTLIIRDSTITGNAAGGVLGTGGGIAGFTTITNSTISGNSATLRGGGIGGVGVISNSTISENRASKGGGISGGTAQNTIMANNSGGNCAGTTSSNGYNLSSDETCNFTGPGDMNNINPLLGPLANNGGPTQTMALLAGSPAIDAGNSAGCTDGSGNLLKTDQRGQPRPDKEDTVGCDIGAYEKQSD